MSDRENTADLRLGTIVHANTHGMFVIVEPSTNHEYVFTLDKVKAYDGGDPTKIGLALGKDVHFAADNGKVVFVAPQTGDTPDVSEPPLVATSSSL